MYPLDEVTGVIYLPPQESSGLWRAATKLLRVYKVQLWLSHLAVIVVGIVALLVTRTVLHKEGARALFVAVHAHF